VWGGLFVYMYCLDVLHDEDNATLSASRAANQHWSLYRENDLGVSSVWVDFNLMC
jgi:hypothetical protein